MYQPLFKKTKRKMIVV